MRIAAVQHDVVWEDREANHARLAPQVAHAVGAGADLVLLSETFSTGFSMTPGIGEPEGGSSAQWLRISLFVCYDLRFADEFWALAPDTDVYLVPANWPAARRLHWQTLLQARAIENQAYVVGCNRVGTAGDGTEHVGDSRIVSPLGELLATAAEGETILLADVDAAEVARVRDRFRFMADRRPQSSASTPSNRTSSTSS